MFISHKKANTIGYYCYVEYKNWNKLLNIIKKRFIDMENEVVVTCGERKEAKSNKGIWD